MPSNRTEVDVEVTVDSDEVAEILANDTDWQEAQWPAVLDVVEGRGLQATGDPVYVSYTKTAEQTYNFRFSVTIAAK